MTSSEADKSRTTSDDPTAETIPSRPDGAWPDVVAERAAAEKRSEGEPGAPPEESPHDPGSDPTPSTVTSDRTETAHQDEPRWKVWKRFGSATPVGSPEAEKEGHARRAYWRKHATELPVLVALAFVIAIVIKTFLVQAFYIPSGSMFPTLHVGDRVLVEKVSDLWSGPRKGDIVVFERDVFGPERPSEPWYRDAQNFFRDLLGLPTGGSEDYIKRVVAVGGDTLRYVGNPRRLIVNGQEVPQPFINKGTDPGSPALRKADCERLGMEVSSKSCRVPAGMVFVMGDNRGNSEDSRIIGPIDEEKIVGKAFMILWPPGSLGTL